MRISAILKIYEAEKVKIVINLTSEELNMHFEL